MSTPSKKLHGLRAKLDRLVYFYDFDALKTNASNEPHAFIYFITITNLSHTKVTLMGRRWVIKCEDGHQHVFEGQGIVGKKPTLAVGESFSYNSHHKTRGNCHVEGSFHGIEESGNPIYVHIPPFQMTIPPHSDGGQTEINLPQ